MSSLCERIRRRCAGLVPRSLINWLRTEKCASNRLQKLNPNGTYKPRAACYSRAGRPPCKRLQT